MARKLLTFDNFAGGESGELAEVRPPPGTFTGKNVLRYIDGSIGPRPGLKELALTGMPTGEVLGFGVNRGQAVGWFVVTDDVHEFPLAASGSITAMGALNGGTPTKRLRSFAESGVSTYITSYNDKTYQLDHSANTVTPLTSPGGRVAAFYGDRLLVACESPESNRIFYSGAGDPTQWNTGAEGQWFDVGIGYEAYLLAVQRQHLVIAKHDGTWWVLSGTPVEGVLKQVARGLSPHADGNFGSIRYGTSADGRLWFVAQHGDYPAVFTGAGFQTFEHLRLNRSFVTSETSETGVRPSVGVTGLTAPSDVLVMSGSNGTAGSAYDDVALLFTRGVWTKHEFDVPLAGWVDGRLITERRAFFCDGGGAGTAPKIYALPYDLGRPPISGNAFESIGDGSNTPIEAEFTLPEYWAKSGEEIQVDSVTIEFTKWDHGFAADNSITVTVTPMRVSEDGDGAAVSEPWTEDAGEASATGSRDRRVFKNWSDLPTFGNGFKIKVSDLVGVSITRIHVAVDTRPGDD